MNAQVQAKLELANLVQSFVQLGEAVAAVVQQFGQENAALRQTVDGLRREVDNLKRAQNRP